MADDLIFPIGFDLEKAVNEAGQQWDKKYAKKLEDYIGKRPVKVKLDFENLTDVKARLAQLKIELITPETKAAIKELARELQVLAKALEQVQKYSSRSAGTAEVRGARVDEIEAKAAAARELARQRAAKAEQAELKLAAAREKSAAAANKATTAVDNLTKAYGNQTYYIERLLRKMVAVWSVQQVKNFLTSVREVTAQFELQRVSLGAIIQDQNKANQLFSEIKAFALKSPVSILDLTKYTKQLAAYKIGVGELFETTKKLTDVSVGLGVSMDRVVLAYGQTRATGYLRASEIRQFTEMGVPIVEELAAKLSKMNGELVTAADVMDLVSKRGISFELVKEVFDDMTSAGGIFYNMQEKQGNTLFGMWAKLGDAASVMYDEIGNTDSVNEGMKSAIQLLTELMRNWKAVSKTIQWVIIPNAALIALYKYSTATQRVEAAQAAATAATERKKAAVLQLSAAIEKGSVDDINAAIATLEKAKADEVAAKKATTRMGLLKSGFASVAKSIGAGLGIGLVIGAVTTLAYKLFEAYENAHRLDRKLDEIDAETPVLQAQSIRNFEFLAKAATEAADGSRQQKDALDELNRTYKDILPQDALKIENLRNMKGNYEALTVAIREYIAEQQKQKQLSAIEEEFGAREKSLIGNIQNRMRKGFMQGGGKTPLTTFVPSETEISRFISSFLEQASDTTKTVKEKVVSAFKSAGIEASEYMVKSLMSDMSSWDAYWSLWSRQEGYLEQLDSVAGKHASAIEGVHNSMRNSLGDLGEYNGEMEKLQKLLHGTDKTSGMLAVDTSTYQNQQFNANTTIKLYLANLNASIKEKMGEAADIFKNGWVEWVSVLDEDDLGKITTAQMDKIVEAIDPNKYPDLRKKAEAVQIIYNDLVPKDAVVRSVRSKFEELANSMGLIDKVKGNLMGATEGLEDYRKKINDIAKDYGKQVENLTKVLAATPVISLDYAAIADKLKSAKDLKEFYSKMAEILGKSTSGSGRTSDPRLQSLKEEISLTKKLYDEYHKLEKQIGATKAAEKIQEIYSNTIKTLQGRAAKYGFEFELPFTDENLKANMQHFIDKMKELQGLKDKKGKPLFPNIGKEIDEAVAQLEDVDLNSLQKALEKKIKALADRISRTKTAKEFYEKILGQTGDAELAARVSLSIYGSTGEELFEDTVKQIREVFKSGKEDVVIDLAPVFDMKNQRIDYKMLADIYEKYQDSLIAANRETAKKIAQEGQKEVATNIDNWQKELAKAKDFEQQRTDIIRTAAAEREKIIKEVRDPKEREELLNLSREKESQDLAKVNFEEFTKSEDYVRIFENLDNAATGSLKHLRAELQKVIDTNRNLSPENMKTLVKAMEDIDEQIGERNPFETLVSSAREYVSSIKGIRQAKQELAAAEAEYKAQEPQLTADIETAKAEKETADTAVVEAERELLEIQNQLAVLRAQEITDATALAALQAQEIAAENKLVSAKRQQNQAEENVAKAVQKQTNAQNKVAKAQKKLNKNTDNARKSQNNFLKSINNTKDKVGAVQSAMEALSPILGDLTKEGTDFGDAWLAVIQAMETFQTIMTVVIILQEAFNIATESNPWMAVAAAVLAVVAALSSYISNQKVKKANEEIERQQELLDELEYSYGRLEKAIEKAFGADYISVFKRQQQNLEAQAEAYRKMAEAERSKGKKADQGKIKEYEDSYRDVMDEIADMQGQIAAQMLGTDLTSAARDFAQAWLDAYKEFGNTADAMSEKFHEMIENMVVESLLARVMEKALKPMFDMIDQVEGADFYSESFWSDVAAKAKAGAAAADFGAQTVMRYLEQAGIQVRDLGSELTGMSRDIAGASEESITGLAAGITTQNHYIAQQLSEVRAIRSLLEGGGTAAEPAAGGGIDLLLLSNTAMGHLSAINRHTAETVAECRRIAERCTAMAEDIHKVVVPRNVKGAYGVQVWT